jgi:hypothetical protein
VTTGVYLSVIGRVRRGWGGYKPGRFWMGDLSHFGLLCHIDQEAQNLSEVSSSYSLPILFLKSSLNPFGLLVSFEARAIATGLINQH